MRVFRHFFLYSDAQEFARKLAGESSQSVAISRAELRCEHFGHQWRVELPVGTYYHDFPGDELQILNDPGSPSLEQWPRPRLNSESRSGWSASPGEAQKALHGLTAQNRVDAPESRTTRDQYVDWTADLDDWDSGDWAEYTSPD